MKILTNTRAVLSGVAVAGLAAELRPLLGDRLLSLEAWTAPDGRETLFAVVEDAGAGVDRSAVARP